MFVMDTIHQTILAEDKLLTLTFKCGSSGNVVNYGGARKSAADRLSVLVRFPTAGNGLEPKKTYVREDSVFFGPSPLPFGGSTALETHSSTTSRSRPRTRGESIRG